jgi:hypothetical protein
MGKKVARSSRHHPIKSPTGRRTGSRWMTWTITYWGIFIRD